MVLHEVRLDPLTADWSPTGRTIQLDVSGDLPLLPYDGEFNTAYADTAYAATLWPALLEKGFAALDTTWNAIRRYTIAARGYSRLDDGMNVWETAEALAQLTGVRAGVRILQPDTAELAIRYRLAHQSPVLVHTAPPDDPGPGPEAQHGVYPGHTYELTTIHQGGSIQLRNPWGLQHPTLTLAKLLHLTGGVIVTLTT